MTIESWKAEFYIVEADSEEAKNSPISHSLIKWKGTMEKNLKKHNLFLDGFLDGFVEICYNNFLTQQDEKISFDSTTCSLCQKYERVCFRCAIGKLYGMKCADIGSPYDEYRKTGNPRRMISLLQWLYDKEENPHQETQS